MIPLEIQMFLVLLEQEGYKGTVVGGAARDTLCNRPIKDWDIHIQCMDKVNVHDLLFSVTHTDWVDDNASEACGGFISLRTDFKGQELNVIWTNESLTTYMNTFSCDLSQMYIEDDTIHMTAKAKQAVDNRLITFMYASDAYMDKIKAKYSDWSYRTITEHKPFG